MIEARNPHLLAVLARGQVVPFCPSEGTGTRPPLWGLVPSVVPREGKWLGALWEKGCHRGGGNGEGR